MNQNYMKMIFNHALININQNNVPTWSYMIILSAVEYSEVD